MVTSFENEPDNTSTAANTIHTNNSGSVDADSTTIPCKRTSVTYGFASSSNYIHLKALSPCESDALTNDAVDEEGDETTSEPLFKAESGAENLPKNCRRLTGAQADKFLQNLPLRHSERLRKFVEANEPTESEHYVWIRNNTTSQITLLSLQTVLNYVKNTSLVKRVKWRHLSFDRITVYRYSVPSIASTKERMHFLSCLVQHQRYLLLILWLAIVLLLIASIIFGSLYSSNNSTNSTQITLNFSQYFTRY